MIRAEQTAELGSALRNLSGRIALVPTMGNLHQGHLALVERARELADHVVVSIFVNPLQFDREEDLIAYPRTLEEDAARLESEGVGLLFAPGVESIYPEGLDRHTRVEVPVVSEGFCGESRPGHFVGVATLVCKLFNLVRPEVALFGKKDYQQLLVIRKMVRDLAMAVRIVGVETVREADGLAMSSRNHYLSEEERRRAPVLYQALRQTAQLLRSGRRDLSGLEAMAVERIEAAGLK
ncbi:MAG TPA: pantoate--beta-alanine ligase, partial [Chromatiaceae bacterium]|nr:pantoate--beta-alanine ligase [Chromatiaceae bacterium]